uniref:Uncharacterized protein n=1 Tax=Ditylenchus dipsaci TaxID=166011 RepID=A0A915DWG4_9BILA
MNDTEKVLHGPKSGLPIIPTPNHFYSELTSNELKPPKNNEEKTEQSLKSRNSDELKSLPEEKPNDATATGVKFDGLEAALTEIQTNNAH